MINKEPVPKFATESEEAQWWYEQRDRLTEKAEAALARGELKPRRLPPSPAEGSAASVEQVEVAGYNGTMPILIRSESQAESVPMCAFSKEDELERLLAEHPELLGEEEETIELVARQIDLPQAGVLDLLFVNGDGLPIAVETKIRKNPEARREVVGQVIDYMASLTDLTVDELNRRVGGKLRQAIDKLTEEAEADQAEESESDRLWEAVGTNLRAGQARLVVALDEAPQSLEKIFHFLARRSQLDVRLVTVQKHTSKAGDVFVPRTIVNPVTERDAPPPPPRQSDPRFLAVINAYDSSAPAGLRTTGRGRDARWVRPGGWPTGIGYAFWRNTSTIAVLLGLREKWQAGLADCLAGFDGREVADHNGKLSWRPNRRLKVELAITLPPEMIAQAMHDLIKMTKDVVTNRLSEIRRDGATPAAE